MSRSVTKNGYRLTVWSFHSDNYAPIRFIKTLLAPLLLMQLLSACAVEGDFGRIEPTVFSKVTDQVLLNADIMTRGLERPELNRDEIALRESGDILTTPLELVPQVQDIPMRRPDEVMPGPYERDPQVIPPGLIARSLDRDHQVLTRFGEAARRVIRSYGQQMESILRYDPVLQARKRDEARARMQMNLDYIDTVFASFGHRLQAYHYAIASVRAYEHGRYASEMEASLAHLRDRTAQLDYELKHYAGAVMARGEYHEPRLALRSGRRHDRSWGHEAPPPRHPPYPDPAEGSYGKSFK